MAEKIEIKFEKILQIAIYLVALQFFLNTKVRSLYKDGKQTAGCTEFRTETGLCSLVSVQKLEHLAVCLPSLKRERTLILTKKKEAEETNKV